MSEIYSVSGDTPYGIVNQPNLINTILNSAISTNLIGTKVNGDVLTITFVSSISGGEQTILDNIVATHLGTYPNGDIIHDIFAENIDGIGGTALTIEGVIIDNGLVDGRDISAEFTLTDAHIAASSGVHGVIGNVVGTSDTQTLTNKTINADSNTITNIDNNEIKAAAAIDATKIANGTVANSAFQQIAGLTSPAVGTTQTQTLTNKTLTLPIISAISNVSVVALPTSVSVDVGNVIVPVLTNKTITSSTNTVAASQLRTTGADVIISGAAPPVAGQVLEASSATVASWVTRLSFCDFVTNDTLITTTSTTHILATGMTLTPVAGSYAVFWSASVSSTGNSGLVYVQVYAGNSAQGSEIRFMRGDSSTDNDGGIVAFAKVSVNGSQTIEGRWRQTGGTGEMRGRNLMIIRVAP